MTLPPHGVSDSSLSLVLLSLTGCSKAVTVDKETVDVIVSDRHSLDPLLCPASCVV